VTPDDSPLQPERKGRLRKRFNWRVRGGIAAALFVTGVAVLAEDWWRERARLEATLQRNSAATRSKEDVDSHALRIERTYGIRIGYEDPADFWTPPYKPEDGRAPWLKMTRADPRNVAISLNGIEAALEQYPRGFVAKLIKAVFICGELRMQGEYAAGTVGPAWVIIAARSEYGPQGLHDLAFVTLHHELSSLVLRVDPLTWSKWVQFAPVGRQYAEQPGEALRAGRLPDPPLDTGFLNAYGATNLENDFNMYAEEMFSNPGEVIRLARKYSLIRRKLNLVMETYATIDPEFRNIFRKRGLEGEISVGSPRDRMNSRSSSDSRNLERSRIRRGY